MKKPRSHASIEASKREAERRALRLAKCKAKREAQAKLDAWFLSRMPMNEQSRVKNSLLNHRVSVSNGKIVPRQRTDIILDLSYNYRDFATAQTVAYGIGNGKLAERPGPFVAGSLRTMLNYGLVG